MKVLILHNSYQNQGGEDRVVELERMMLLRSGHDVQIALMTNKEIVSASDKLNTFLRAPYNPESEKWLDSVLSTFRADIIHVHNFFPLMTPAVHIAAAKRGLAVIQTLHNYRLLCSNAIFLRNGAVCEKCLHGSKVWGIVHRCYRGSAIGAAAVARMQWRAERNGTWHKYVHRFIALTQFAKGKFVQGGLPEERIAVKPNFAEDFQHYKSDASRRKGILFVGRLSPEKGAETLLDAFAKMRSSSLTIVGSGPEMARLQSLAPAGVTFMGALSPDQVAQEMSRAQCLVYPSISYEGFGLTIVEAFAAGLPVVASRIGSPLEIVKNGITGLHFTPSDADDLAKKLSSLMADDELRAQMGARARETYEANFTPDRNLATLENIYDEALQLARARPFGG